MIQNENLPSTGKAGTRVNFSLRTSSTLSDASGEKRFSGIQESVLMYNEEYLYKILTIFKGRIVKVKRPVGRQRKGEKTCKTYQGTKPEKTRGRGFRSFSSSLGE